MDFLRMLWLSTLLAMAPHCVSPTTSYVGFYPTGRAWEHVGTRRLQTGGSRPAAAAACCPLRPRPVPSRLSSCSRLWYAATHDERSVAAGAARFAGEGQQDTGDQDGVQGFYGKAEQLLKAAGGQLDSLAFGRNWKRAYPGDDLEKYKGAGAATIAQMLAQSPRFRVADRPGGGPGKLFILDPKPARPEPAASSIPLAPPPSFSSPAVEQRQSKRGYSFSVIKKDPTRGGAGSGTVRATSNPPAGSSRTSPEAQGSSQPYEERNAPGNSRGQRPEGNSSGRRGKASELIDIWSQAASLSDADDAGRQEHMAMEMTRASGGRADAQRYSRLINEHARSAASGDRYALDRAFQVLQDMEDDGVDPNTYTYTALITACAKAAGTRLGVQAVDRGLDLLGQMRERAIEADTVTYNALLDACAKAAAAAAADGLTALDKGFALLGVMERSGPRPDYVTYNTMMHACAKAATYQPHGRECLQRALQLLDRMEQGQVTPQVITYNALVDTCARAGQGRDGIDLALSLLSRMEESGLKPDAITYNSLINTCARAADSDARHAFESALAVLARMEKALVCPNVVTFNSLATIVARAAQAGEITDPGAASSQGQQVLGLMLTAGVKPNVVTLNALLSAVVAAGLVGGEASDDDVEELLYILSGELGVQPNVVTWNHVIDSVRQANLLAACDEDQGLVKPEYAAPFDGTSMEKDSGQGELGVRGRGEVKVEDIMEALDIVEVAGPVDGAVLGHIMDAMQRSKERVLHLLPLLRRLVSLGARPELAFFHSLLNRCMSFGGDGLGESLALIDIMDQIDVDFNAQTEAIADRIREAHDNDPELVGLEAWDLVTPEIRGAADEEDGEEEEDWIQIREMSPETERVLLSHAMPALDTPVDIEDWDDSGGIDWLDADDILDGDDP